MTTHICRSALYMPANNARATAKLGTLNADAVILDLEDSVAPEAKQAARLAAVDVLQQANPAETLRVVRINAMNTAQSELDLDAVSRSSADAVLVPKVESVDDVQRVLDALTTRSARIGMHVWLMIETPAAILNAAAMAAVQQTSYPVSTWCIGNNDLALAARLPMPVHRDVLRPWYMQLLAAARAHGVQLLDGVFNRFRDLDGFELECQDAARMGLDGKTLIHPSQIAVANRVFSPSPEDVQQAQRIVQAFEQHGSDQGVIQIDGEMVERLHLNMALQTLARSRR